VGPAIASPPAKTVTARAATLAELCSCECVSLIGIILILLWHHSSLAAEKVKRLNQPITQAIQQDCVQAMTLVCGADPITTD
jgi:hypothetical protein